MPLDLAQKRLRVLSRRVKKVVDDVSNSLDGTMLFRRGAAAAGAR